MAPAAQFNQRIRSSFHQKPVTGIQDSSRIRRQLSLTIPKNGDDIQAQYRAQAAYGQVIQWDYNYRDARQRLANAKE